MVKCQNLSVKYQNHWGIKNLNIDLDSGGSYAIVGRSGCGKTTLLHAIAGLIEITEGSIYVDGQVTYGNRSDIAIILQDDGLFPWKTVYDNVALNLRSKNLSKDDINNKVGEALLELDMQKHALKYPKHISGGERKRVAIARSLVTSPSLLLMDEPTGSLDQITKEQFGNQILSLYKEHRTTMIVVTHDIEEAVYLGKKIIVMKDGEITFIFDNPTFLKDGIRDELEFYELCLKVRSELSL